MLDVARRFYGQSVHTDVRTRCRGGASPATRTNGWAEHAHGTFNVSWHACIAHESTHDVMHMVRKAVYLPSASSDKVFELPVYAFKYEKPVDGWGSRLDFISVFKDMLNAGHIPR